MLLHDRCFLHFFKQAKFPCCHPQECTPCLWFVIHSDRNSSHYLTKFIAGRIRSERLVHVISINTSSVEKQVNADEIR